ncbi:MAG: 30S ribosomal protein S3 [Candidatus Magasanikbacteria bacterium GW2011_GWD2_43_18]|uniref:Small ribosomal subunit protein uS3 n=1 Tax=Candidatus Magasanikbacteria bacterium GW2011_GWE2_42_7 TaxID=1619052 RepID=A0A0G1E972_9BACT|nr:MAG: 30S ribosomal protein S3 [Candidatus Magasanikbacteria bacterium GW2011_GWC2_42_27]KKS71108.1 MAG: 30S ribosomal protein S3 [Candidatus Magasanikbacteria bacterium GW2011_GWE2_42_7]KKT04297.1 MAG: 30S ribosomal protein S3 [Candidatus Magasanikbacteria bacterium GW2011_GWD2_43_18]KKT24872.1 MAG: 30S ribosomal protein S3 [Candidatus Magasanikbacteria bacterium GW2011_GWA2_43_9]HBB38359.1 30S ribosomal protein S3 [Candidatus Magasanikbacteria bacterium]
MGHKVHPKIHRTGIIYTWDSRWFSKDDYATYAEQDIAIRTYLGKKFKDAHIDRISIERGPKNVTVTILAAKPGYIIGRGGKGLDDVRKYIERKILKMILKVKLNVREVSTPALSAMVVGQSIATDLEKRIPFRRSMKQSIKRVMEANAGGVKIQVSGRLNGADIARSEKLAAGKVPLITLRGDVDYGRVEAHTTYGVIGVKVWIYHGEVFGRKDVFDIADEPKTQTARRRKRPARRLSDKN